MRPSRLSFLPRDRKQALLLILIDAKLFLFGIHYIEFVEGILVSLPLAIACQAGRVRKRNPGDQIVTDQSRGRIELSLHVEKLSGGC